MDIIFENLSSTYLFCLATTFIAVAVAIYSSLYSAGDPLKVSLWLLLLISDNEHIVSRTLIHILKAMLVSSNTKNRRRIMTMRTLRWTRCCLMTSWRHSKLLRLSARWERICRRINCRRKRSKWSYLFALELDRRSGSGKLDGVNLAIG